METLTITQFNQRVNMMVTSSDMIRDLSLVGEISGLTRASSGHIYLDLKDSDSVIRCTFFRGAASRLKFVPQNGMKVTVYGSASYYVKGGSFSFNIESMSPFGKGEEQIKLELLTAKLLGEGLFDEDRKKDVPRYPRTIGVVTSATGAVIKDIIDTVNRRGYPADILLAPASVQGDGAAATMVRGIHLLESQNVDVIIVGRGGGSAEDLSAFNDEELVRTVAACRIPVISAVGHAVNKSLCDRAADKYAETPTAAAMIAVPDVSEELRYLGQIDSKLNSSLKAVLTKMRARFDVLDSKLSPKNAKDAVDVYSVRLSNLSGRMDSDMRERLMRLRSRLDVYDVVFDPSNLSDSLNQQNIRLDDIESRMKHLMDNRFRLLKKDLEIQSQKLEGLDPNKVLARGYSMITDPDGNVITSVAGISEGSDITVRMRDGTAEATVKGVKKDE